MKYNNFDELQEAYFNFSDIDKYAEALNMLEIGVKTLTIDEFEKHQFSIMIDKCYFYFKCEMYEKLFDTLMYMIDRGFVCPLYWFDDLNDNAQFIKLKEKNDLLLCEVQRNTKFQYIVHLPKGYTKEKKYPLFLNLHGDGDSASYHKQYWNQEYLLSKDFIVVYLQSSQLLRHEGYVWIKKELYLEKNGDEHNSERFGGRQPETYSSIQDDIKNCNDSLMSKYSIDSDKIIIGGFSGGAMAAIDISMANIIPIKGVIALCSLKPKSFTQENIKKLLRKNMKFVFMEGEEDIPVKDVEEMMEECENMGIPYEYYINKGIGHWYPEDLDDNLGKALSFIFEQSI